MHILFYSLFLTILLEFMVIWIILKEKPHIILFYAVLINSLTLPLATYGIQYLPNLFLIEIIVILTEIPLIRFLFKISYKKSVLSSFAANIFSVVVGLLILSFIKQYFYI